MKIEKLITLSEFVYLIGKKDCVDMNAAENLGLIYKYNSFLSKPLKKEMFVNEVRLKKDDGTVIISNIEKWQEAEKKVIFDGDWSIDDGFLTRETVEVIVIDFRDYATLEDLSLHNWIYELKLKNVEI